MKTEQALRKYPVEPLAVMPDSQLTGIAAAALRRAGAHSPVRRLSPAMVAPGVLCGSDTQRLWSPYSFVGLLHGNFMGHFRGESANPVPAAGDCGLRSDVFWRANRDKSLGCKTALERSRAEHVRSRESRYNLRARERTGGTDPGDSHSRVPDHRRYRNCFCDRGRALGLLAPLRTCPITRCTRYG